MKFLKTLTPVGAVLMVISNFAQEVDADHGHSLVLEKDNSAWTAGRNDPDRTSLK